MVNLSVKPNKGVALKKVMNSAVTLRKIEVDVIAGIEGGLQGPTGSDVA